MICTLHSPYLTLGLVFGMVARNGGCQLACMAGNILMFCVRKKLEL